MQCHRETKKLVAGLATCLIVSGEAGGGDEAWMDWRILDWLNLTQKSRPAMSVADALYMQMQMQMSPDFWHVTPMRLATGETTAAS